MHELRTVERDLAGFGQAFAAAISADPEWKTAVKRRDVVGRHLTAYFSDRPYHRDLLFAELAQATLLALEPDGLKKMAGAIAEVQAKFIAFVEREQAYPRAIALPNDCAQCVSEIVGGQAARTRGDTDPGIGGNYHEELTGPRHNQLGWNFHWAGVVMKDGGDNVTLESAAGMSLGNYDRQTWWFGMYGTHKPEQTFKHQIRAFHYQRNIDLLVKSLPDGIENYTFGDDFGLIVDIAQMRTALRTLNGNG